MLTGVAGILFVYYNQFISPQAVALTTSAEVLLMVISGGAGTLLGPIVGAAIVVDHQERGQRLSSSAGTSLLGAIFVAIVIFMPEGLVPGTARLWRLRAGARRARRASSRGSATEPTP